MISVALPQPLRPVVFLARANRFAAHVRADGGRRLYVHLPNSGRMADLLVPGASCLVHSPKRARGRTRGVLLLVRHRSRWVGLDAHLPNRLLESALRGGGLPPFTGINSWRRDVRVGRHRIDFALAVEAGPWLVEVKSCNRVEDGVALFPDGPTARGTRHLRVLAGAARRGVRSAVVWVVQRSDARVLRPDATTDPAFAAALTEAAAAGVGLYAFTCQVGRRQIRLAQRIPVSP